MRSPVQIWIAAPKTSRNRLISGVFVLLFVKIMRIKKWVRRYDPQLDPHGEMRGKVQRAPDRKFGLPVRCFVVAGLLLHHLGQDAAHGIRRLVLYLAGGVSVDMGDESCFGVAGNQQLSSGMERFLQCWLLRSVVECSLSLRRYSGYEPNRQDRNGMRCWCSPVPAGDWKNQIQADCHAAWTEQLPSLSQRSSPIVLVIRYADEGGWVMRKSFTTARSG